MSLINEIQNDIVNPNVKLSDILRKATILAHHLKSEEFQNWVDQELNSYKAKPDQLPAYRILGVQTYGHFAGSFGKQLRNAPIHTQHFPKEIHEFATTQPMFNSIREFESMVESGERIFNFSWPADFTLAISDHIYEDMTCLQAWKLVSVDQIAGIIDTVKNRILDFILELEDLSPEAGESRNTSIIPPEKVSQVFNNFILGSHNIVGAGANVTQSITQTITPGDFGSLRNSLKSINVEDEDIEVLSLAIEQDGSRQKKDGMGQNVNNWIGRMVNKTLSSAWNIAVQTAPILLVKAISSYYGWNQ